MADDLLKNDGQKFLEMMEQLAERRMQREVEASVELGDNDDDEDDDGGDDLDEDEDDLDDEEDEEDVSESGPTTLVASAKADAVCHDSIVAGHYDRRTTHGRRSTHVPDLCRPHV